MSSFVFGVDIFVFVFGANESTHSSFTCGRKAKTDKKKCAFSYGNTYVRMGPKTSASQKCTSEQTVVYDRQ